MEPEKNWQEKVQLLAGLLPDDLSSSTIKSLTAKQSATLASLVQLIKSVSNEPVEAEIVSEEPKKEASNTSSTPEWSHLGSCGEEHPGRTHEVWKTQVDALSKGFAEGRG